MRRPRLPDQFTSLGKDAQGREYIQCTRTGDVLIQTDTEEWSHFAGAREWRAKTAARLYPELIHLQRALKRVGKLEEMEDQLGALREAEKLLDALKRNLDSRIDALEAERVEAEATVTAR